MSVWIFGYGSLVWRPDFPSVEDRAARIHGFVRRFWQGSTDHRGVPGAPGRVVTVLPDPSGVVWGRAFRVAPDRVDAVLERLDHREKGGYERDRVDLIDADGHRFATGLVYRATPSNPNWLGPASVEALAAQVRASTGPSGPNDAYVIELARALHAQGVLDDHVEDLARALGWRPGG